MKKLFYILIICLSFVLISCNNNNNNYKEQDYENYSYNPSLAELKQTNIPVLILKTEENSPINSKEDYIKTTLQIESNDDSEVLPIIENAKIKGRGNSSWGLPKKPYTIKLDSKTKILGMKKAKKWVLIANYSDKSLLRNFIFYTLGKNTLNSSWAPTQKSVHLILNDEYRGVYLFGECVQINENRVDIDDISEDIENGGFIFEVNKRLDEEYYFITKNNVYITLKDPDEGFNNDMKNKVHSIIQKSEDALFSDDFKNPNTGYRKYFDIDSIIDWYLINELAKNVDGANFSSIYFYYDPSDALIHMGPIWDFDISAGNINYDGCDDYHDLYIRNNSIWINRMSKDPYFREKVEERWNEKKNEILETINTTIDEEATKLNTAADMNFNKWEILGQYVWPNPDGYQYRTEYSQEVAYFKNWLLNRYNYLNSVFGN